MSKIEVDKVDPQSGTALEIGTSGDTITVPTGAGLTVTDEVKTNKISPATGVAFALGDSGDTFTIPSGATITNNGTATGFAGGVGIDQTWQDVIGSRALNVYYTNSTGGPIQVFIIGGDIGNSGDIKFYYTPDGGSEIIGTGLYTNSAGGREQMTFTVPDGDQYKCYGAGTAALVQWWELS